MAKAIHSSDPRKPAIQAALRAKSGGTKVTLVEESAGGFKGQCSAWVGRGWKGLGVFEVTAAEAGLEAPKAPKGPPSMAVLRAAAAKLKAELEHPTVQQQLGALLAQAGMLPKGKGRKLEIVEACAVDGCTNPPKLHGVCADHLAAIPVEPTAAKARKERLTQVERAAKTNANLDRQASRRAAAKANAAQAKWDELAAAHAPMREHTRDLVAKIEATGMRRKALAAELGITGTRITRYAKGQAAAEPGIRSQLGDILARREVEAEAKATKRAARKAPAASASAEERPASETRAEMKQLILDLRSHGTAYADIAKWTASSLSTVQDWRMGVSGGSTEKRATLAAKLGTLRAPSATAAKRSRKAAPKKARK